jgi:hypothetical protein
VTETEVVYRTQTGVVSPGVGAAGTVNDVSNTLNEFGRYDARKVGRTATAADTDWIDYTSHNGTNYVRAFRNQNATWAKALLTGSTTDRRDLSIALNEFGLIDGHASKFAEATIHTGFVEHDWETRYRREGAWYKLHVYVKHFASVSDAADYAEKTPQTGYYTVTEAGGHISDVTGGPVLWKATRVEVSIAPI